LKLISAAPCLWLARKQTIKLGQKRTKFGHLEKKKQTEIGGKQTEYNPK